MRGRTSSRSGSAGRGRWYRGEIPLLPRTAPARRRPTASRGQGNRLRFPQLVRHLRGRRDLGGFLAGPQQHRPCQMTSPGQTKCLRLTRWLFRSEKFSDSQILRFSDCLILRFEKCQAALVEYTEYVEKLLAGTRKKTMATSGDEGGGGRRSVMAKMLAAAERGELGEGEIAPNLFFLMAAGCKDSNASRYFLHACVRVGRARRAGSQAVAGSLDTIPPLR